MYEEIKLYPCTEQQGEAVDISLVGKVKKSKKANKKGKDLSKVMCF